MASDLFRPGTEVVPELSATTPLAVAFAIGVLES